MRWAALCLAMSGCTLILGDRPGGGRCGKMDGVYMDDFSGAALSQARWDLTVPNTNGATLDGGRLRMVAGGTAQLVGKYSADLRDSSFTISIDAPDFVSGGAAATSGQVDVQLIHSYASFAADHHDASGIIDLQIKQGSLHIVVSPGASPADPTQGLGAAVFVFEGLYDPVAHHTLRVREQDGVLFFEAAPAPAGPFALLGRYGDVSGQDTRFVTAVWPILSLNREIAQPPLSVFFDDINSTAEPGAFCPISTIERPRDGFRVGGPFQSIVNEAQAVLGPPMGHHPNDGFVGFGAAVSRTRYSLEGSGLVVPVDVSRLSDYLDFSVSVGDSSNGATVTYARSGTVGGNLRQNPDPTNPATQTTRQFCNSPVASPPSAMRISEEEGALVIAYTLDGETFVPCVQQPFAELSPLFTAAGLKLPLELDFSVAARGADERIEWF